MLDVYNQPWYLEAVCPGYRTYSHDGITFNYYINERGEASSPYGYAGILESPDRPQSTLRLWGLRRSIGLQLFIRHRVCAERPEGTGVFSRNTRIVPISDPWTRDSRDFIKEAERASRLGIKAEIRGSEAKALEEFRSGYRAAMHRKSAGELHLALGEAVPTWTERDEVLYVSTRSTGSIFLVDRPNRMAHYYLSYRSPDAHGTEMYAVFSAVVPHLAGQGIDRLHLGGGMTNDPQDSLYRFKAKVGRIPHQVFFQEIP